MEHPSYTDPDYVSPCAQNVITKMGGIKAVQKICGLKHPANVAKWTYPKSRHGTGGRIPGIYQQLLLDTAYRRAINLKPADFLEDPASKFEKSAAE